MYPIIRIGQLTIPSYGLMTLIGFAVAIMMYIHAASFYQIPKADIFYASIYAIIGLALGAKILYALTALPSVIRHSDVFLKHPWYGFLYLFSGWVFYGGLLGGFAGIAIYCRKFQLSTSVFLDVAAPCIPLFHVFGRIGCLLAGCCYGREYDGPLAITYPENSFTDGMVLVKRIPVPVMEAAGNLFLFLILYRYIKKKPKSGRPVGVYLVSYSSMRFLLEFLRGDASRGIFLRLSTSQWVSILLLPVGIWLCTKKELP